VSAASPPGGVVFLFGAGASFAAGKTGEFVSPAPPPLMTELYDALALEFSKEWGPDSRLGPHADEFRQDFEDAFTRRIVQEEYLQSSLTLLEALVPLARFFARFSLRPRSHDDLYSRLVAGVADVGALPLTTFGSLNYDCLLELAVDRLGYGVDWLIEDARRRLQATGPSARVPDSVRVAKLHGSCNFVAELRGPFLSIVCSPSSYIEAEVRPVWPPSGAIAEFSRGLAESRCFPTMCQLSRTKHSVLSPAKITQIQSMWAEAVRTAALVVVIGVRPVVHDEHVFKPLHETAARRCYIGAAGHFAEWSRSNAAGWKHLGEVWEGVDGVLEEVRGAVGIPAEVKRVQA
jgi:hypothetical protein